MSGRMGTHPRAIPVVAQYLVDLSLAAISSAPDELVRSLSPLTDNGLSKIRGIGIGRRTQLEVRSCLDGIAPARENLDRVAIEIEGARRISYSQLIDDATRSGA